MQKTLLGTVYIGALYLCKKKIFFPQFLVEEIS